MSTSIVILWIGLVGLAYFLENLGDPLSAVSSVHGVPITLTFYRSRVQSSFYPDKRNTALSNTQCG